MSASVLIDSINGTANNPPELQEKERLALMVACDKLKSKLENPRESAFRILFAPHQAIALRLAIDMKLFDAAGPLAQKGDVHLDELASRMSADPLLVARVMRFLVGMGIFTEAGPATFTAKPVASVYVSGSPFAQGLLRTKSYLALPAYFSKKGFKNPGDAFDGPFQFARNTELHCFKWLPTEPKLQHAFNVDMATSRAGQGQRWFEVFPVASKLQARSPSNTLLVDIGGGVGHDLIAFKQHYPSLSGLLVVQEIPVVVDSIAELPVGIQAMKYDFFNPQPVKGAKAYYLGNVIHDWPDKQVLQILGNIKDAMEAESILLINENMIPNSNVPLFNFSSLERTEKQFRTLLDTAGLKVVGVWMPDSGAASYGWRLLEVTIEEMPALV